MTLRKKLNLIINGSADTLGEQKAKVEALMGGFGHSIIFLEYPNTRRPFNCFSYALDVIDSEKVNNILKEDALGPNHYGVKFGTDFILQLINHNVLKYDQNGEIIIYFSGDKPVHGGKIINNRVTSKWGTYCLWEHAIWEVPIMYGDNYKVFARTDLAQVEKEFDIYFRHLSSLTV